jgi:hypothetical protein
MRNQSLAAGKVALMARQARGYGYADHERASQGGGQLRATIERIRAPASAAASAPGLVLCVAGGVVRIIVHVVAGEDFGGRA